jgi:hypothetical protein
MPESKRRKRKVQTALPPLPPQSTVRKSRLEPFSRWLFASWWHQVEFTVSLFVGTVVICGWIYDALREPEIHPSTAQLADPFELPFSLHNPSFFFSMSGIEMSCGLYSVRNFSNGGAANLSIMTGAGGALLKPGATKQYTCPVKRFFDLGQVATADIEIRVIFKTLSFARSAKSDHFNWTAKTGQWTEGESIR